MMDSLKPTYSDNVKPSKHLERRLRKRANIKRNGCVAFLERALNEGIRLKDIRQNLKLYRYIKNITRDGYYSIIFKFYVLVFSNDNVGITLLFLPKEFYKQVQYILDKRKGVKHCDKRRFNTDKRYSEN